MNAATANESYLDKLPAAADIAAEENALVMRLKRLRELHRVAARREMAARGAARITAKVDGAK
jgi:hypothetical protein